MKLLAFTVPGYTITGPSQVEKIQTGPLGQNIFQLGIVSLFLLSFVLAIIFLLLGGIQWIMSGGDKEKIQKARGRLTYSIVGLIIVLLSFFIVNLVGGFFGAKLLDFSPSYTCGFSNPNGTCPNGQKCAAVSLGGEGGFACIPK